MKIIKDILDNKQEKKRWSLGPSEKPKKEFETEVVLRMTKTEYNMLMSYCGATNKSYRVLTMDLIRTCDKATELLHPSSEKEAMQPLIRCTLSDEEAERLHIQAKKAKLEPAELVRALVWTEAKNGLQQVLEKRERMQRAQEMAQGEETKIRVSGELLQKIQQQHGAVNSVKLNQIVMDILSKEFTA